MLKRIIAAVIVLLPVAAVAQTGTVQGLCSLGGTKASTSGLSSTNYLDGIIPSCTITVYLTGTTTKATIYADAANTPLGNPFTANAVGSVKPGGWMFWAATNQGLDVVMSGGIAPNTFPQPVTLTDVYPGTPVTVGGAATGLLFGTTTLNDSNTPPSSGQCLYYDGTNIAGTSCGSSGATFQTNGTNNASQSLLNLKQGTNVTLSNSGGDVTISSTGGSGGGNFPSNAVLACVGTSWCGDDVRTAAPQLTISSIAQSGPIVTVDTTTAHNLSVGEWGDFTNAAGFDSHLPANVGRMTGYDFFQVASVNSATEFTINVGSLTETPCSSSCGTVESAMNDLPFTITEQPGMPTAALSNTVLALDSHGPSLQYVDMYFSTLLGPWNPSTTGKPLYIFIDSPWNDLGFCETVSAIEGYYTDIFTKAHAWANTYVLIPSIPANDMNAHAGAGFCTYPDSLFDEALQLQKWLTQQAKSTANKASGAYWDIYAPATWSQNTPVTPWQPQSWQMMSAGIANALITGTGATMPLQAIGYGQANGVNGADENGILFTTPKDSNDGAGWTYQWLDASRHRAMGLGTNSGSTYPGYLVLQGREKITAQPNAGFNSGIGALNVTLTGDSLYEPVITHVGTSFTPSGGGALFNLIRDQWQYDNNNYDGMQFGYEYNSASSAAQNFALLHILGDTLDIFHACPGGRFAIGTSTATSGSTPPPANGCPDATALLQVGNAAQWKIATNGYPTLSGCASGTYLKADGTGCGTPSGGGGSAFSGGLGTSYQDVTEIAAPVNPSVGNDRLYLDSTSHQLSCLTSDGANCMPTTSGSFTLENGGTSLGAVTTFNCSTGTTCSIAGSTGTITASGGGSSAKLLDNPIDAVPGTSNAMDDEWTGETSLNAKWTAVYNSSGTTQFINSQTLYMTQPAGGPVLSYIYQTAPATPWTVTTKIKPMWAQDNYRYAGLVVSDSTGQLETFYLSYNNGYSMQAFEWSNGTTPGSAPTCTSGSGALVNTSFAPMYMSLQDDGTNLTFKYSYNGTAWNTACVTSRTGYLTAGPTRVGLVWGTNNGTNATGLQNGWFRRTQ